MTLVNLRVGGNVECGLAWSYLWLPLQLTNDNLLIPEPRIPIPGAKSTANQLAPPGLEKPLDHH